CSSSVSDSSIHIGGMPHSICAVGRWAPATNRVPHDERLICYLSVRRNLSAKRVTDGRGTLAICAVADDGLGLARGRHQTSEPGAAVLGTSGPGSTTVLGVRS